jgi:hypothetical protein
MTQGNVDDRQPAPYLAKKVIGKLFGDRDYISKKLTELLATLKKNMKPRVIAAFDAIFLRNRSIIETITDQLKKIFQLEYSRHRSLSNYMINAVACLVAYLYQVKSDLLI